MNSFEYRCKPRENLNLHIHLGLYDYANNVLKSLQKATSIQGCSIKIRRLQ
jgi:hypothetical protein